MRIANKGKGACLLAAAAAMGAAGAPVAGAAGEGKPVKMGKRNPGKGSVKKETRIVGKPGLGRYVLRAANSGAGGGAQLTCRSVLGTDGANPKLSTPCLRAANAGSGEAFQFSSLTGTLLGVIQSGAVFTTPNPNAKPFVTNATGVADGLNADKVDGRDAEQIIAEARQAAPGSAAPSFAFGRIGADGKTDASRTQGIVDANISRTKPGVYCFAGLTSRPKNAQATLDGVPGEIATDTTSNTSPDCAGTNIEMIVRTYNSAGTPEDKGFQVAITGGGA